MRVAMIGSRTLTKAQHLYCESIGSHYAEMGHIQGGITICSGNAIGADQAFVLGAMTAGWKGVDIELYLPWQAYESKCITGTEKVFLARNATRDQVQHAMWAHPAWHTAQKFHPLLIRNVMLIWDAWLVIAHPNTEKLGWGGTGHAIRAARLRNIPVYLCNRNLQRNYIDGECN